MATGSGSHLPAFEEIIKRGSASEPKNSRPAPKIKNSQFEAELSLNAAVDAAKSRIRNKANNLTVSATDPSRSKQNGRKKKSLNQQESGFSSEGSPGGACRRRTPMTMPRTKVTAATPLEQKIALNKLKQRLDFDNEDKEKQPKKGCNYVRETANQLVNGVLPMDAVSVSSVATSELPASEMSDFDVTKLNERLNQVREYLKQATSMYVSLSIAGSNEPERAEQMNKLAKLIQQLRIQERGYLDLFERTTNMNDVTSNAETASCISTSQPSVVDEKPEEVDLAGQRQELERLRDQQSLLKTIVDQQKELQQLKDRQSTLLKMQENAENVIREQRMLNSVPNNQRVQQPNERKPSNTDQNQEPVTSESSSIDTEEPALAHADAAQKRLQFETKLLALQERKDHMDALMENLKALKNAQNVEANMSSVLNQDDLSEVASELAAVASTGSNEGGNRESDIDIHEKITRLNDVRERLHELRSIVADYESGNLQKLPTTDASRDNRLHAQAIQQKEGNTLTGAGGARLRLPNINNQDVLLNDLQALQNGIEELMDNRNWPVPHSRQKIDVTRNPSSTLKSKNTNQEVKKSSNITELESMFRDMPEEFLEKMKELDQARQRLAHESNFTEADKDAADIKTATTQTEADTVSISEKESDIESNASSALQWQEDPEFQTKVKKLQMAKEKLHHLQELVKVVQQGDGPNLPIDDLEDLTLTVSDDSDTSEYGESEEEAGEDDDVETGDEEQIECEDGDEENTEDEQSEVSKSTDHNFNLAQENGLSDNERRYQGLLRKQRLELNYLLKERERLLEAQQKLSLATQPAAVTAQTQTGTTSQSQKQKSLNSEKAKSYPVLTKEELKKQNKYKQSPKRSLFAKLDGMSVEPHIGSEHDFFPQTMDIVDESDDIKGSVTAPLSNPMAVSEIRRQRELFEQRKKQKFVEKQRRKKKNRVEENQSDDRATYSVHSDIDEGVGVSMYSADVTTAATWGGSTEQSSSEEDSAVGEEYPASANMENEEDEDEYGSQFDQVEEEEEVDGASNVPPIFKVRKYPDQPRRGISWYQNDVAPNKKTSSEYRGNGSVSWSLDVSPPRSRRKPRQGNLTPAHKLIQDNKRKRRNPYQQEVPDEPVQQSQPALEQLHGQLAGMCTSLLRNEQTLLSMLQSQNRRRNEESEHQQVGNSDAVRNMQEFFETSNYNGSFQQTLNALKSCFEHVEQHQLDMEFLRQQFTLLNPSAPIASNTDYRSPWPNPPSLHLSSFGGRNHVDVSTQSTQGNNFATSIHNSFTSKPAYQRGTQTETTLFEDPFTTSIQPYSLFGDASHETGLSPLKKDTDFTFEPVIDPTSPGAVGERSFSQQYEEQTDDVDTNFPYRLRMSEYNPMSYQGNFANTSTGNVITMSRMSMNRDHAETHVTENAEKNIWPSFFKLAEASAAADNTSERSSKYTSSITGHSASNELTERPVDAAKNTDNDLPRDSSAGSNFSLFEALRDSIYSEVATLIAMNESRPHFLIELFRELQLLNSDYLRQRALYSLQELVTRFLTDETVTSSPSKTAFKQETIVTSSTHPPYEQWVASASEQTPSESVMTTDDENESQALQTLAKQIQNNELYDYAELAETQSEENLSTPGSHCEIPFAAEDLGNTVINLDEALQKMKMYEQNMAEAKKAFDQISHNVRESTPSVSSQERQNAAYEAVKRHINANFDSVSNSSAGDVTSETSDLPQPSVDTRKLDRQIKSVMMDLIPFLNEHIESICTEQLLDEIRNLIVQFAKQKEPGSEQEQFGRFFHMQLDSILRDSLMKFNSRKLKECGEDILIDVSEILFNELAFFRLMQDLDRPLYSGAVGEEPMGQDVEHSRMPFLNQDGDDSSVGTVEAEEIRSKPTSRSSSSASSSAYVVVDPMVELTDEETESSRQFVKVELSVSETRPIRSSGSGEDDNEEEPSLFSKVYAPASSIHLYSHVMQASGEASASNSQNVLSPIVGSESQEQENDQNDAVEVDRDEEDQGAQEDERSEQEREAVMAEPHVEAEDEHVENENAEDQRDLNEGVEAENDINHMAEDEAEGQAVINQQNNNIPEGEAQNDMEEGEEDDLPEADMASDENVAVAQVILAHLEGQQELAGEADVLPPTLHGGS